MDESGLTPAYQVLSHNDRELDNDETIESAGVLAGDTIVCKEVVVEDLTHDDDVMEERGFGGTALRGRQGEPAPPGNVSVDIGDVRTDGEYSLPRLYLRERFWGDSV